MLPSLDIIHTCPGNFFGALLISIESCNLIPREILYSPTLFCHHSKYEFYNSYYFCLSGSKALSIYILLLTITLHGI